MEVQIIPTISQLQPQDWQALEDPDFPFADYEFLKALEDSGCVGENTGWNPVYLVLRQEQRLLAALYCYHKFDSYGEYIFDWDWANAYLSHGLRYYPKLLTAVPFTPATGSKILLHPQADPLQARTLLIQAALHLQNESKQSGFHALFIRSEEIEAFRQQGMMIRHSYQYHWFNQGYGDFQDFVGQLKRKRRKEILRERRRVEESGLEVVLLRGEELTEELAEVFYDFYLSTILKKYAYAYLNLDFFKRIFKHMSDKVILLMAREQGCWVAGTISYLKGKHLYGRYWGCVEEYRHLHFELCYYRPVELAIEWGLEKFEAGAQGEHKHQRGFVPVHTYSAHWIGHPQFRQAIERYVRQEQVAIEHWFADLSQRDPFKNDLEEPDRPILDVDCDSNEKIDEFLP